MKNDAGIAWRSRSARMRGSPTRAPYCPCDSSPIVGWPKRRLGVSLSTSNESATATRAPFGQRLGCNERPARTACTTFITVSVDHSQPCFTLAWARSGSGASAATTATAASSDRPDDGREQGVMRAGSEVGDGNT
jgi:hypothetical protein